MARGLITKMIRTIRKMIRAKGGQSIIEYAMFIAVVVLALLAMQVYLKRGLQGKIKDMADQISPALYNPNLTIAETNSNATFRSNSFYDRAGVFTSYSTEMTNQSGSMVVQPETVAVF